MGNNRRNKGPSTTVTKQSPSSPSNNASQPPPALVPPSSSQNNQDLQPPLSTCSSINDLQTQSHLIPAAFDLSDPQRAMGAITSLVNMFQQFERIKEEIQAIDSPTKTPDSVVESVAEEGNPSDTKTNKKNVEDVASDASAAASVQDVFASDDHQGTPSDLKNDASVREIEDDASRNVFEEDKKKKKGKKKGKASSKRNKN